MLANNCGKTSKHILNFCVILLIAILSFSCLVLLESQRTFFLITSIAITLVAFLSYVNSKFYKKNTKKYFAIIACCLIALLAFYNLFFSEELRVKNEGVRLKLLHTQYQGAAADVLHILSNKPNTGYDELPEGTVAPYLSVKGQIFYSKRESSLTIYFPTENNFFHSYGYMFKESSNSGYFLTREDTYLLDDTWAYVKLY